MKCVGAHRFYSIGPNCVVHLNEKSKDQIEFDEVGSRKVVGEMGRIKTSAVGMNGFYGCMCFSVVCLAVGIPILVIATFVNQWAAFECVRGAAVELSPCDGVDDTYYCPVSLQPSCSGIPSNCSVSLNTTSLSTDDQQTLYVFLSWSNDKKGSVFVTASSLTTSRYDMAETDVVTVYCCVDEFWCTADLYNSSLADGSAFIFDLLSAEVRACAERIFVCADKCASQPLLGCPRMCTGASNCYLRCVGCDRSRTAEVGHTV